MVKIVSRKKSIRETILGVRVAREGFASRCNADEIALHQIGVKGVVGEREAGR